MLAQEQSPQIRQIRSPVRDLDASGQTCHRSPLDDLQYSKYLEGRCIRSPFCMIYYFNNRYFRAGVCIRCLFVKSIPVWFRADISGSHLFYHLDSFGGRLMYLEAYLFV